MYSSKLILDLTLSGSDLMFAGTTTIPVNGADDTNANGQNPTTNYSVEIDATIKTEADTTIKCEVVDGITTMPSIQQAGKVTINLTFNELMENIILPKN